MKAKILLLALAIMGTSLVFSQSTPQLKKTDCEKKVLKKIQRKMNMVSFNNYIKEGSMTRVLVTCVINKENLVEIQQIEGTNEELNAAIIKNMAKHPVKCESEPTGKPFAFYMTFKHLPY